MAWEAGQRVAIDGRRIVTIDRVTPSGWAVVGSERFDEQGREIGEKSRYRPIRIQPLTTDLERAIAVEQRCFLARDRVLSAADAAEKWVQQHIPVYGAKRLKYAVLLKAERLAAAIRAVLDEPEGEQT